VPPGQLQTLHLHIHPMRADDEPWFVDFVAPIVERFAAGCLDLCLSSRTGAGIGLARHPVPRRLLCASCFGVPRPGYNWKGQ
jgi:hypothetical protein